MSTFWFLWIFILTAVSIGLILWLLLANKKVALKDGEDPENRTTGHVYDGIEEYDNPLPKWWFLLFIYTIVFAAAYLVWYPGVWQGLGGWTSTAELKADQDNAQAQYAKSYEVFSQMPVEELIHDNRAMKMGMRLFANNCAVCHGADGGGNFGIPNLTDQDYLYGSKPDILRHSIENGRAGNMPAWGDILGEENIQLVSDYVLKISGQEHVPAAAALGKSLFEQNCAACHGPTGRGQQAMGAPNLTDDVWLYDGTREGIVHAMRSGFSNAMPAQKDLLREEKIHVLTAYVYNLSFNYE